MSKLPRYLTTRKLGFYAVMEIPKPVRPLFDMKPRFLQSLQTRDQRLAERRLPIVIARWKDQIEKAQGAPNASTGLMWEIMEWRKAIHETSDDVSKEVIEGLAYEWVEKLAEQKGVDVAKEAHGVIFNTVQPLSPNIESWAATITHLDAKTQSLHRLAVTTLCDYFKTTARITEEGVEEFLLYLRNEKNLSDKTIGIRLSPMRSFMQFMDKKFKTRFQPLFTIKALPRVATAKTAKQRAWVPFTAQEVAKLWQAALEKRKPDQELADLIAFGAYTGCRIEELAQLRVEDFSGNDSFRVTDSKTAAGIREVPVHPALSGLVERLKEKNTDGFLLQGSDEGSFGKRSDAMGKRFGKLKTKLGFGPQHVFHSIRKTVVSQLEQAGVSENTTADIVGHDKPRITYGLYSAGASLKQKAEALALVTYEGGLANPARQL
jgi:integrase